MNKAQHVNEHRGEFEARRIAAVIKAVKGHKWTTRSATKRVGRHPNNCNCPLHRKD
jgi:hypothetical protein